MRPNLGILTPDQLDRLADRDAAVARVGTLERELASASIICARMERDIERDFGRDLRAGYIRSLITEHQGEPCTDAQLERMIDQMVEAN